MSRLSVDEIMVQIASTVNQEATEPATGSSEWALWLQYINRGVFEWANTHDWEVLRKTYFPIVTGTNQGTVSLPQDFRKIGAPPVLYNGDSENGVRYGEALPEQEQFYGTTEKYYEIRGDISTGFSIILHPQTLASGASLVIQYFSMPTALASGVQYPVVPDSQFLVNRTIAYIFEARSDSRFQLEEQKARDNLLNMIENQDAAKYNSYSNNNPVISTNQRQNFRLGRD
jgi:hypothetical protein